MNRNRLLAMQITMMIAMPFFKTIGEGGAGDDLNNTGDFDVNLIPEDKRPAFDAFKQTLIDKGVNIGIARAKTSVDSKKDEILKEVLKNHGLTVEDLPKAKELLPLSETLKKVYETAKVETLEDLLTKLSTPQSEENDVQKLTLKLQQSEAEKSIVSKKTATLENQLQALQDKASNEKTELTAKQKKTLNALRKNLVTSRIQDAAIANNAYDPMDVVNGIGNLVDLVEDGDDYRVMVLDQANNGERFNSDGNPFTISDLVAEYLNKKPHLKKSSLPNGPDKRNFGKNNQTPPAGKDVKVFTAEQLKDPKFFSENYNDIIKAVKDGKLTLG